MQLGRRVPVRAGSGCLAGDPNALLWSAALAQNAALNARIALPEGLAAGRACQLIIRDLQVVSKDANLWEFWFWGNSLFQNGTQEYYRGAYAIAAAGLQIGGAGNFYASATGLDIFYEDADALTTTPPVAGSTPDPTWRAASNGQVGAYLNVSLINRSAGAKTAGAYFDVTFICEPTLGHG